MEKMAEPTTLVNGMVSSQEEAIDLDTPGPKAEDGLSELNHTASSILDQIGDANGVRATADHESPLFVSEGSPSVTSEDIGEALNEEAVRKNGIAIIVPPVENAWEYRRYEESSLPIEILEEYDDGGLLEYLVRFDDESEEVVSFLALSSVYMDSRPFIPFIHLYHAVLFPTHFYILIYPSFYWSLPHPLRDFSSNLQHMLERALCYSSC